MKETMVKPDVGFVRQIGMIAGVALDVRRLTLCRGAGIWTVADPDSN